MTRPATPPVSVVVASHGRRPWLARTLTALRQLDYPAFEIVLVADGGSLDGLADHPVLPLSKVMVFDRMNLSAARNAGVALAGGEIVAFIDDDAVPEPLWLRRHAEALAATRAEASVGYVRGRNGIGFQSRAVSVDGQGVSRDERAPDRAGVPDLAPDRTLKLVGTNTAIRRETLVALGGFDPAYRFYLEDADLSIRLAREGGRAAVAPEAQVHHAFAPSPRRTALRCPRQLFDIGRSSAIFTRRHPGVDRARMFARLLRCERARLLRHMVQGTCEPDAVPVLLADLAAGWENGLLDDLPALAPPGSPAGFAPLPPLAPGHRVLAARLAGRRRALAEATRLAAAGSRASVFSFSLTPVRHRVRYTDGGVWLQTGGQFGRSDRSGPLARWWSFAHRVSAEIRRVEKSRGIVEIGGNTIAPAAAHRAE